MDINGAANGRAQPSIRSFFQPRQPNYAPPPAPPASTASLPPPPPPLATGALSPRILSPNPSQKSPDTSDSQLPKSIPPEATVSLITKPHIPSLRRINALLLPIAYPDSFYHNILAPSPPISFSRIITWTDTPSSEAKVIGGIVCRLDPAMAPDSTPQTPKFIEGAHDIYIQSLALLSPYRHHGLVAAALQEVIDSATSQTEIRIASLYAHVWTENEEALEWYSKRGFKREEPVLHGYYRRLKPDTAWIFRRRLVVSDHLSSTQTLSQPLTKPTLPTTPTTSAIPPPLTTARSFQDKGPEREWNDLPEDVLSLKPPSHLPSREGSATSSRSSSRSGLDGREKAGKKKRVYPAAAFGAGGS